MRSPTCTKLNGSVRQRAAAVSDIFRVILVVAAFVTLSACETK